MAEKRRWATAVARWRARAWRAYGSRRLPGAPGQDGWLTRRRTGTGSADARRRGWRPLADRHRAASSGANAASRARRPEPPCRTDDSKRPEARGVEGSTGQIGSAPSFYAMARPRVNRRRRAARCAPAAHGRPNALPGRGPVPMSARARAGYRCLPKVHFSVSTRKSCERARRHPAWRLLAATPGGITGPGFCRSAVAVPRSGGPPGWRSRAGTG
jgi:hypothetical protein